MKRDTRLNLIFLVLFLAVSVPGAVKLFKKRLDPAAPPLFMPDYVRRRLPYMAPQRTPPQVARYVPDKTGEWVADLTRQQGGGAVLMHARQPIVSDDHQVQLAIMTPQEGGKGTLGLIVWDPSFGRTASSFNVSVKVGEQTLDAPVTLVRSVGVPEAVKKELMYEGVVRPPHEVVWVTAVVPLDLVAQPLAEIRVRHTDGDQAGTSTILLRFP
jgi:hypothetical protein